MRRNSVIVLAFLFIASYSFGQLKEGVSSMSQGSKNALSMDLPGSKTKEVTKAWEKYIKSYKGKTKKNRKTGEVFTDNAEIIDMSSNTVDIYAKVSDTNDGCMLTVWFDLGGAFLSSSEHNEKFPTGEKILYSFALTVSKGMVEDELKAEEKKLKALNNEQKSLVKQKSGLEKDIVNYKKDIENYKKKIAKAEKDIEDTKNKISQNVGDQKAKQKEVDTQQGVIKAVKKKLKDLE